MIKRIAFFADKTDIEEYFGFSTRKENLFEAHYNITPGHHIPVVISKNNNLDIIRIRWGQEDSGDGSERNTVKSESVVNELLKKGVSRCLIPLSGFFVWKETREKEHPFFVRMLNKPFMSVAGLRYKDSKNSYVKIVTTESNALIQPMSPSMPLLFDEELTRKWLDKDVPANTIVEEASSLFLLTDLSVLRVSKDVNDPINNNPDLIQPIPK